MAIMRPVENLPNIGLNALLLESERQRYDEIRQTMLGVVVAMETGDRDGFINSAEKLFRSFGFETEDGQNRKGWERNYDQVRDKWLKGDQMVDVEVWGQEMSYGNFYLMRGVDSRGEPMTIVSPGFCSIPNPTVESAPYFAERYFYQVFEAVIGVSPDVYETIVMDDGEKADPREVFVVYQGNYIRISAEGWKEEDGWRNVEDRLSTLRETLGAGVGE